MRVPTALIGCQVSRVSFDYHVRLLLIGLGSDEGYRVDAELVIEVPFVLRDSAGERHEIDPGVSAGAELAPAIDLFNATVTAVDIGDTGSLRISFDSEAEVHISPHPRFESWSLVGHGVTQITVCPGGETARTMAD